MDIVSMVRWCNWHKSGIPPTDKRYGQAGVEFALVLPMLLLVLFAMLEYGWYLTWQFTLNHAVTAGARAGVTAREWEDEDPELIARTAVSEAFWLADVATAKQLEMAVTVEIIDDEDEIRPRTLQVSVQKWSYHPLTGFLPQSLLPSSLSARSVLAYPR